MNKAPKGFLPGIRALCVLARRPVLAGVAAASLALVVPAVVPGGPLTAAVPAVAFPADGPNEETGFPPCC